MAILQNNYTGNGNTTDYSFTFEYIQESDIEVRLNDVVTTQYFLASPTIIRFNTAPANGVDIHIRRNTSIEELPASFFPGSSIRAQDLNTNFVHVLYVSQESQLENQTAESNSIEAVATANEAKAQAASAENKADNAVSTANSTIAKADSAVATAETANSNASAAVDTANSAASDASQALTTANAADSKSDVAIADSSTALSNSNQAIATSNQANSSASSALATANSAESKADSAVATADDAEADADTALTVATNALTIADGIAQSGEPFGQLYNSSTGSAGSKVIDLGDLSPISNTGHFPNEDQGVSKYTCSEGTGIFNLGVAA